MRRAVALSIVAVSIAAAALTGIVTGAAAPAFAATPAPLSGTADALTQSASDPGTWTTTAYLNTAALCAEPVTFSLQLTPSPGKPVPLTPASSVIANCGPGETASPITAVTLSASLAEVPLSATLVVTPSPVAAASETQLDVTLAVHRHVSVYQYLVIPVCCGAVLAALLIIATVAFGVPRSRRPARPPRSRRRNAHLDKEDFWRRPLYAASAWTWGDSWVTNITAVGTLIGTVLTASPGLKPVTFGPTDSTVPAASYPSRAGNAGSSKYWPERNMASARFRPSALTAIRTSPFPGGGTSTFSIFRTSGPPV